MRTPLPILFHPAMLVVVFGALQFVPPYASLGYDVRTEWNEAGRASLDHPIWAPSALYPVFKILPIVVGALAFMARRLGGQLLAVYATLAYVAVILHQAIGSTPEFGMVVPVGIVIMFGCVAAAWCWEAYAGQNDFRRIARNRSALWVIPLALLALWYPLDPESARPDFGLNRMFTNGAGMAFCMVTPWFVGLMVLIFPHVNLATLRIASAAGVVAGLVNMHVNLILHPRELWWNGVLHLPLLFISGYALALASRMPNHVVRTDSN